MIRLLVLVALLDPGSYWHRLTHWWHSGGSNHHLRKAGKSSRIAVAVAYVARKVKR